MNEYNIDYKAMFEDLAKRFNALLKADEEFFALTKLVNEQNCYTEKAIKHFNGLKRNEQIELLRILSAYGALCKTLCEKYSLFDDEEGGDNDV